MTRLVQTTVIFLLSQSSENKVCNNKKTKCYNAQTVRDPLTSDTLLVTAETCHMTHNPWHMKSCSKFCCNLDFKVFCRIGVLFWFGATIHARQKIQYFVYAVLFFKRTIRDFFLTTCSFLLFYLSQLLDDYQAELLHNFFGGYFRI